MKLKCLIFCAVFILFTGQNLCASDDIKWKLIENRNNVLIFADEKDSSVNQTYKAVFVVHAPVEKVVFMLNEASEYREWMPGCFVSDVIHEKKTKGNMISHLIHVAFEFTWPVKSRDFIALSRFTADIDGGTFNVEMDSTDQTDIQPPNDTIRINHFHARFDGEYLGGNKTRIVFVCNIDPGGNPGVMSARYISVKIIQNISEGMMAYPNKIRTR